MYTDHWWYNLSRLCLVNVVTDFTITCPDHILWNWKSLLHIILSDSIRVFMTRPLDWTPYLYVSSVVRCGPVQHEKYKGAETIHDKKKIVTLNKYFRSPTIVCLGVTLYSKVKRKINEVHSTPWNFPFTRYRIVCPAPQVRVLECYYLY